MNSYGGLGVMKMFIRFYFVQNGLLQILTYLQVLSCFLFFHWSDLLKCEKSLKAL